jgi:D-sedoheptulose 7-phosphate isomerase
MSHLQHIKSIISSSIETKLLIRDDPALLNTLLQVCEVCTAAFKSNRKVLFCGNGGSAADAQHLAAEFSGKFYLDRTPLFAEALHVNSSYLTAVANDYSFDEVYSRMIDAKGNHGDILFALSTSGNSKNVINAAIQAQTQGLVTIGLTGKDGGQLKNNCDYLLNVPSVDTPRIQESHILLGHIICEITENNLFS